MPFLRICYNHGKFTVTSLCVSCKSIECCQEIFSRFFFFFIEKKKIIMGITTAKSLNIDTKMNKE